MFQDWEDYKNGMYSNSLNDLETLKQKSIDLLSNDNLFFEKALEMIFKWPVCADYNLSNTSLNRRAWIGQATCNYVHFVPEIITRLSWSELSEQEKLKANFKANKIIKIYENRDREIYKNLGTKVLF